MRLLLVWSCLLVAACSGPGNSAAPPIKAGDTNPGLRPGERPVSRLLGPDARGSTIAGNAQEVELVTDDGALLRATLWRREVEPDEEYHPEYRDTVWVRLPVDKDATQGSPMDVAARQLAEKIYEEIGHRRDLTHSVLNETATRIAAGKKIEVTNETFSFPRRGRAAEEFAAAAFSLPQAGMVTPPTRTQWGWDLILVTRIVPAGTETIGAGGLTRPRAVVLVHQLGSDRYEWDEMITDLSEFFTVISIDLRGHGGSTRSIDQGPLNWKTFTQADWDALELDVKAAVEFLRALDPPPPRVAIAGASIGSSAAIRYAAVDPDITAVALLSPGLDYHGLDTVEPMEAYGPRPALLVTSRGDVRSVEAVRELTLAARNETIKEYGGKGHGVSIGTSGGLLGRDDIKMVKDLLLFLRTHLDPPRID